MKTLPFRILLLIPLFGFALSVKAIFLVEADFEDLTVGALAGQAGGSGLTGTWSVSGTSAPQVVGTGLSYTASDGGVIDGGTRSVTSPGSGDWVNRSLDGTVNLAQSIYVRYLVSGEGTLGNQEVFNRYNGWDNFSALKYSNDTQENRMNGGTAAVSSVTGGLSQFETYLIVDRLTYDGTNWNNLSSWINPVRGDEATPFVTNSNGPLAPGDFSFLDLRFQNEDLVFDEFVIATEWEDVVPEAVPEPSVMAFTLLAFAMGLRWYRRRS